MNIPFGSEEARQFITNVGLITTNGPIGHNISADEWTHHISYSPGLIAICIHKEDATAQNILKTKEFGVNLAAVDQNIISSIAGRSHGFDVDKISALKEFGVEFFKSKKINVLMVKNSALSIECKVIKHMKLGDHITFIGKAIYVHPLSGKQPLLYHSGKYFKIGKQIIKPKKSVLKNIETLVEKYRRKR
jgi:flavin reductase (DIM6/NTAB) family NADH-FMN oxidoreductase RutF